MFQLHDWERSASAHAAVALGGGVFLAFCVGCMNFSFGGKSDVVATQDSEFSQKGTGYVPANDEISVYYPIPYQYPPNLQLPSTLGARYDVKITEQSADHFRAKNMDTGGATFRWEARGVKFTPNVVPTPTSVSTDNAASKPISTIRNP